ncbi:MAG: hypothetical protein HN348_23350 [Proteobacteria bacterium]|mgnify:CR=1 FL=1|nr:hypothetical protein [Pseudomonadota bacterium]
MFATDVGATSTIDITTYLGSELLEGDTISCEVTVDDGYESGTGSASSLLNNHH